MSQRTRRPGQRLTKAEVMHALPTLFDTWRTERGLPLDPPDPSFQDFFNWLQDKHSLYAQFRTTTSVKYDLEHAFDRYFKQTWRN